MTSISSIIFLSLALSFTTIFPPTQQTCPRRVPPAPTTPSPPPPAPTTPPPSPHTCPRRVPPSPTTQSPPPPPPSINTFPNLFYRCLTKNSRQSPIPFTAIFAPSLNATAFTLQLNSTPFNQRCLHPSLPKPLLIFAPLDERQVPAFITCAKSFSLAIRLRSRGHNYECLSFVSFLGKPFLVLDLQNLQTVQVDAATKTAWVQAGATTGQLYYKVANDSGGALAFPAGLCMTLGMGGHIPGGAYGALMRAHGLGIDNVLDARMVMANGTMVLSVKQDEDLLWAILGGGGGNFGVVVAWLLRLVEVPPKVTGFNAVRVLDTKGMKTLNTWQKKVYKMDTRIFIRVIMQAETTGGDIMSIYNAIFLGNMDELMVVMKKGFSQLRLDRAECTEMTWLESMVFVGGYPSGTKPEELLTGEPPFKYSMKGKSFFPRDFIKMEGLRVLRDFHSRNFSLLTILNPLGGVMANVGENDTPYPHRKALSMIQTVVTWEGGASLETDTRNLDFAREVYQKLSPYIPNPVQPGEAYVNYMDLDLGVDGSCDSNCSCPSLWGPKYYISNFDRLIQVKAKVDSSNFFNFEQSIPLPAQQGQCVNWG